MNKTTVLIKDLRQETGASFLDCKQALLTHGGDYEQAVSFLRQKNLNKAAKKAQRQTADGLIIVKANADAVALIELDCETDFVALTPDFKALAHLLADMVLADDGLVDVERLATAVHPAHPNQTIQETIQAFIGKLGENIKLAAVGRYAAAGNSLVHGYVHAGAINGYGANEGRLGVLVAVEIGDETAVAPEIGNAIAHDLALHIASAAPKYVTTADIPTDVLAKQRERLWRQVADEDKPDSIKEKIVAGRLNKFYKQNCLMVQPFIKDDGLTVTEWLAEQSMVVGTAVFVARFARVEISA